MSNVHDLLIKNLGLFKNSKTVLLINLKPPLRNLM